MIFIYFLQSPVLDSAPTPVKVADNSAVKGITESPLFILFPTKTRQFLISIDTRPVGRGGGVRIEAGGNRWERWDGINWGGSV